jgi:hypothetical protein
MTAGINSTMQPHSQIGYDLVGWARKIKALGDMIQAASKAEHYLEISADTIGVLGDIIWDYGCFIESATNDLEDEISEVWKELKFSRVRLFNRDVERFKKFWKADDPRYKERAKGMINQIDSYIEQNDPLSLYKTREELLNLINRREVENDLNENQGSSRINEPPESKVTDSDNCGSVVRLDHANRSKG